MDAKAKEFTEVLKEQYYAWFAQYMVMKRSEIMSLWCDIYYYPRKKFCLAHRISYY